MKDTRTRTAGPLLVALLLAGAAVPAAEAQGRRQALLGRWQLNEKESEDPKAKFTMLQPGEQEPAPALPGTPPRWPDDRRRPGAKASPPPKLEAPPDLGEFLEAPTALTISARDAEVTLDGGEGRALTLATDGERRDLGSLSRSARWDGASLIVETRNQRGARLTTRYNPMPEKRQIEVYSRLAGVDGRAVTLRRVYDAVPPAT